MSSENPVSLEFWFDFASTYSHIAAWRIEALCRAADLKLKWRPFLLGPIFKLQGWNDSHFNLNPRRGVYMWRDMERLTHKFIRAVFLANFSLDLDIAEVSVAADILIQLGQPARDIIEHALDPDQRAILRKNTERAIEIGIFGAPNCLVGDELFWGEESLEDAIEWALRRRPVC
jgi:2-hydroxychromene-2-carboxylate isomerase